jgi:hypothetical protein
VRWPRESPARNCQKRRVAAKNLRVSRRARRRLWTSAGGFDHAFALVNFIGALLRIAARITLVM